MTEKFKQAVEIYVNCSEKINRTVTAANANRNVWSLEKLMTASDACEKLAEQGEEAKKIIVSGKGEIESEEEYKWFMEKMKPYISHFNAEQS